MLLKVFITTFFIREAESLESCPTATEIAGMAILFFSDIQCTNAKQIFSITSFVRLIFSLSTPSSAIPLISEPLLRYFIELLFILKNPSF